MILWTTDNIFLNLTKWSNNNRQKTDAIIFSILLSCIFYILSTSYLVLNKILYCNKIIGMEV